MRRSDPKDRPSGSSREERIARVVQRGQQLRRRRQALHAGAAAVLCVAVAFAAIGFAGGDERVIVTDAPATTEPTADSSPTTAESSTTTTPETATDAGSIPSTTVEDPVTESTVSGVTETSEPTPSPPCRDSFDQACGPWYWDPAPAPNQPLAVDVSFSPEQPQPGDEVTFHVKASDPDARIARECYVLVDYGDGDGPWGCPRPMPMCVPRFGAWTPPEPAADHYETTFTHTYSNEGDFTATFTFYSSTGVCYDDPYESVGTGQVTVTVRSGS